MMRELNRGTVYSEATAKATENRDGEATVTVQATFAEDDRFSTTSSLHLSETAALALLLGLYRALAR